MRQPTYISIWCERIIEAGWLLALTLIPIYFNLLSARHFEPDKATTLRALVVIMAAAALIRALEYVASQRNAPPATGAQTEQGDDARAGPLQRAWKWLNSVPLLIPILFYGLIFIITTITSVVPHTSFWGSYQRLQGTYTNLSYIVLAIIIISTLRRREQFERIITVTLMAGLVVAGYGVLQNLQLDPLPWRGDVVTRVASTMGNSIFVAAYLIMLVPLGLYRLVTGIAAARDTNTSAAENGDEPVSSPRNDLLRGLASVLLIGGTLALLLSVIKFGAAVRVNDFRYWWFFPGGVIVSTSLWWLLTYRPTPPQQRAVPFWPGAFYLVYLGFFTLIYTAANNAGVQNIDQTMANAVDWWIWMLGSLIGIGAFYLISVLLPKPPATPSRLATWLRTGGYGALTLILLITVIFSQSRGPWLGLGVGLFVFFILLLWQLSSRAADRGDATLARRLRLTVGGWVALTFAVGGFLIAFNVSDAPIFDPLRNLPYIGRMGNLLEVDQGTGRVRTLIWAGDEHAGGALALIAADPLRTAVGWGPESMFVAFNQHYPPTLATIESRGASPDRSHQAVLDELVTKGFLGLTSYLFLLFSFGVLAWRLMRSSRELYWQVFFIAALSSVAAHFVEGLTGIPIVSTLTMFWVLIALTVVGGMLAGHYVIGSTQPVAAPTANENNTDEAPEAEPSDTPKGRGKNKSPKSSKRGRGRRSTGTATPARAALAEQRVFSRSGPLALFAYAVVAVTALFGAWWFNLGTVYADMRFSEGQAISQQDNSLEAQVVATERFLETVRSNPREDFYYLNLGRSLMTLAEYRRLQGEAPGQASLNIDIDNLLELSDANEVVEFIQTNNPQTIMRHAEGVLLAARQLNPMNKDHYANLGRLHNFWFSWEEDPSHLEAAADWYSQANEIAPQDVTLLNEHANVRRSLESYYRAVGNETAAAEQRSQAWELINLSYELDPRYLQTLLRLSEFHREDGELEQATELFIQASRQNGGEAAPLLEPTLAALADEPELLAQVQDTYLEIANNTQNARTFSQAGYIALQAGDFDAAAMAYAEALEREPENLNDRFNYARVLSETQQYDEALSEAQEGLRLAQQQTGEEAQRQATLFQQLITVLQEGIAGGE